MSVCPCRYEAPTDLDPCKIAVPFDEQAQVGMRMMMIEDEDDDMRDDDTMRIC